MQPAHPPGIAPATPQVPAKKTAPLSWGLFGSALALGLGCGFLINHLAPPLHRRASLTRYAVALTPAALYLGGCGLRGLFSAALERFRGPEHFSVTNTAERQRQARLGIQDHPQLAATYLLAWLNHPRSVAFSDAEIRTAAVATLGRDPLAGLVTASLQSGWSTRPLPQSRLSHTKAAEYRTLRTDPDLPFHVITQLGCRRGELSLPVDRLENGEVLVALFDLTFAWQQERHILMGVACDGQDRFQLFRSDQGHQLLTRQAPFRYMAYVLTLLPLRINVTMIRLHKDEAPTPPPPGWWEWLAGSIRGRPLTGRSP